MEIRRAELADVDEIMLLVKKSVPLMHQAGNYQWTDDYPNPEIFEQDISLGQLWLSTIDEKIAGVIAITTNQSPEYVNAGWDITEKAIVPHRLAVDPDRRGSGIAQALMNHAEQSAKDNNISILRVDTNSQNKATQGLFTKLGYEYSGTISLGKRPELKYYCYEKRIQGGRPF